MSNVRLRGIYKGMKYRCLDEHNRDYKNYGGRGITICKEWLNSERISKGKGRPTKGWLAFKEWSLSHGYSDNLTIDRIDNDMGYSPENCRWVTIKQQLNNRRNNHFITYKEKTQTLAQWCEELNLDYYRIRQRLYMGWSVKDAFETKSDKRLKLVTYNNQTKSLAQWCEELGLDYLKTWKRINKYHWSLEKALYSGF